MSEPSLGRRGGYLEALLASCPVAILATNAEGKITFANKAACELLERKINEVVGESIVVLYENLEAARETNRRLYQGGGAIQDLESTAKTKTGKLIPIRISASHMHDSSGNYTGAVGYFEKHRPWSKEEARLKTEADRMATELCKYADLSAPVFEVYSGLSVAIVSGDIDSARFERISANLLSHMEAEKTRVALIDLSDASVEDDNVAGQLIKTIRTIHLLGAQCLLAGIQMSVAKAMEPSLTDIGSVRAFRSRDDAVEAALSSLGFEIHRKA